MTLKYGRFELPKVIKVDRSSQSEQAVKFILEAFEPGFAHTLGSSWRRALLMGLEAPGLVSVKIEGVSHEYMALDGVVEDMVQIVLNFKGVLVRKLLQGDGAENHRGRVLTHQLEVTQRQIEDAGGQLQVTVGDLVQGGGFEVINPDHHLFSVTSPIRKKVMLRIDFGRGYVTSDSHQIANRCVDEIVLDTDYSPVKKVNYFVEKTRRGQNTNYDRLVLEIETDGRVLPEEALTFAGQILIHHFNVINTIDFQQLSFDKEELDEDVDRNELLAKLSIKTVDIEFTVRSINCLVKAGIFTIGQLVTTPESEMLQFRNFGKKSLNEIKEKLEELDLSLGMDLSRFGIDHSNVDAILEEYNVKQQLD